LYLYCDDGNGDNNDDGDDDNNNGDNDNGDNNDVDNDNYSNRLVKIKRSSITEVDRTYLLKNYIHK
jgi:hypothetical protein